MTDEEASSPFPDRETWMPKPSQEWQDAHGWKDGKPPPPNGKDHGGGGKQAGRLRVLNVDDLMNLPTRDYLVKGWLSPAEISLLVGAKNARKTFFALHVSYGIAQGWNRIFGRRVKQTPVLYLIAEGEAGIGKRVKALVQRYGRCDAFHVIAQPIDLLRSSADAGDLHDVIEAARMQGVGLIVVDTVSRAMMGGDENGAVDMGTLAANLNVLRHETGAHVMGVHHGTQTDGTKSRGHSTLPFGVDAILQVEWNDEAGGSAIVGFCRDDAIGKLGAFRTEVVDLGADADDDPITTLIVNEGDAAAPDVHDGFGRVAPSRLPFYEALISAITRSDQGRGRATLDAWEHASLHRGLIEQPREGETHHERAARTRDYRRAKSDLLTAKWIVIEGHVVGDLKGGWG